MEKNPRPAGFFSGCGAAGAVAPAFCGREQCCNYGMSDRKYRKTRLPSAASRRANCPQSRSGCHCSPIMGSVLWISPSGTPSSAVWMTESGKGETAEGGISPAPCAASAPESRAASAPESCVAPVPESCVAPVPESSAASAPESRAVSMPEGSTTPAPESRAASAPESCVAPVPESSVGCAGRAEYALRGTQIP